MCGALFGHQVSCQLNGNRQQARPCVRVCGTLCGCKCLVGVVAACSRHGLMVAAMLEQVGPGTPVVSDCVEVATGRYC
jgi:hypothetical protein